MYKLKSVKLWFTIVVLIYVMFAHFTGKLDNSSFAQIIIHVVPLYFVANTASKYSNRAKDIVKKYIDKYSGKS